MPLNESFSRKSGPAKVVNLASVPTSADLNYSFSNARKTPRRPEFLAWHRANDKRLLSVTCGMIPGSEDARWVLRDGHELNSPIIWSHDTADAAVIYTLVSDSLHEEGPAAAIPEFLRPKSEVEETAPVPVIAKAPVAETSSDFSSESPGSIFADRYEIIEQIGNGATSAVYKARQTLIDRIVALKVLHPHLIVDETFKRRFEQEAKATSLLSHPNLVITQDFGRSPLGRPFIVMDYVEGPSLEEILVKSGLLNPEQFIEIFSQCCRGLAHAHKKGLVHRDVKPSNIKITENDENEVVVKILDFGIAKMTRDHDAQKLTEVGSIMGSPLFMSPEQCRAEDLDGRSDIYSLGVAMFVACSGIVPFRGKDAFETLFKHIYEPVPPFASLGLAFEVPAQIETIVQKCMQKEASQRYQKMEDLERDILRLKERPQSAAQAHVQAHAQAHPPAPAYPPHYPTHPSHGSIPAIPPMGQPPLPPYSMTQNQTSPQSPAPQPSSQTAQPATPPPTATKLTNIELMQKAQLVSEKDVAEATAVTREFGGDVAAMLVAQGKTDRPLLETANKCTELINKGILDIGRAIILINYSQRSRVNFDEAIDELGWNLGS